MACDLEPGLVGPVQQLVAGLALGVLEGQLDGAGAVPLDVDDLDGAVGADALDLRAPRQVLETGHDTPSSAGQSTHRLARSGSELSTP